MKKLLTSLILITVGAGSWWLISQTARFSLKKWDAKFESVLRHQLTDSGLTNQEIISSVHEVRKDRDGEWVVYRMSLKLPNAAKRQALKEELEKAGAHVLEEKTDDNAPLFLVKRGARTYQEIKFFN